MQRVYWLSALGWDDPLDPTTLKNWSAYWEQLYKLELLDIPWWLKINKMTEDIYCILRGFNKCWCIILPFNSMRWYDYGEDTCHVASIKQITLPRLELCGAVLLVQLVNYLYWWVDCVSVDQKLCIEMKRFLFNGGHVQSMHNPADCTTRGIGPKHLPHRLLLCQGPLWLKKEVSSWPLAHYQSLSWKLIQMRSYER